MPHLHSVYDNDTHFKIDPITRQIKNESEKVILMQNDHNSERFTFEISRYIDGHDMSLCNKVEVHFINLKADKTEKNADVYIVEDMQISPDSDDVVICSWLISQNATKYAGTLNFVLRYACLTNDVIDYQWYTDIHKGISVSESISNTKNVAVEYSDVLQAWRKELMENGSVSDEQIASAIADYLAKNPVGGGSSAMIGEVTLLASKWVGSDHLYSQVVNIEGVTENSQVDLTPSVEQLVVFYEKDLTLVTENDGGVVTVYAIGQKPANDYVVQITVTEVIA